MVTKSQQHRLNQHGFFHWETMDDMTEIYRNGSTALFISPQDVVEAVTFWGMDNETSHSVGGVEQAIQKLDNMTAREKRDLDRALG